MRIAEPGPHTRLTRLAGPLRLSRPACYQDPSPKGSPQRKDPPMRKLLTVLAALIVIPAAAHGVLEARVTGLAAVGYASGGVAPAA